MPADSKRAQEIYVLAVQLPPDERSTFVDQECGEDEELRRSVEVLLSNRPEDVAPPQDTLSEPPVAIEATMDSGPIESPQAAGEDIPPAAESSSPQSAVTSEYHRQGEAGAVIAGRYTLKEKIGEGGMGEVWIASQTEPVKRRVALKLIKAGMDSKAVLARFEQERQALAIMDHPNIARVIDGGATPAGQPFFVMELVKGVPLNRYCDQHKLTTAERLELFDPICRAVQHAHQKGIIHRDLKPANILVAVTDGRPIPKVIDFGVAKATGAKLTDHTLTTQLGAMVGTLEYMAPEQAGVSIGDVDTRADIYSLGVVLYELLTGVRPIDADRLTNVALTEMIRVIHEEDPSRPSTRLSTHDSLPSVAALRRTEPRRLVHLLRGELDWVVMKCLDKDRERRYETANALVRDIQRYLADEPVEARPPSTSYRLGKFLRRHRGPVFAAGLLAIALIAGIVGTSLGMAQARQAQQEAERAQREAETAQQAEEERAEGERQAKLAAERANAQAQKRLEQVGMSNTILSSIFADLDPNEVSSGERPLREMLVDQLDRAVEALDGEAIGDPLVVAKVQNDLARALIGLGEPGKARALLERVVATRERALGPDHEDTLTSKNNLAVAASRNGDLFEALDLQRQTLERMQATLGDDHSETAQSKSNLAKSYLNLGQPKRAIPLFEEALDHAQVNFGMDHPNTLSWLNSLAAAYEADGQLKKALPLFEDLLEYYRATRSPGHVDTLRALNNLAFACGQDGKSDQAVSLLEEAHQLAKQHLGSDHPMALTAMHNLAAGLRAQGRFDEALPLFEESLRRTRDKRGVAHPDTLSSMNGLAGCYFRAGMPDKAVPVFEELIEIAREVLGPAHPNTVGSVHYLAVIQESLEHFSEAADLYEQLLPYRDNAEFPGLRHHVLDIYVSANKSEQAIALVNELLDEVRQTAPAGSVQLAAELALLGQALMGVEAYEEAAGLFGECVAILDEAQPDHWQTFENKSLWGAALAEQQEFDSAEPLLLTAFEGLNRQVDASPDEVQGPIVATIERLIRLFEGTDREDEAAKWRTELESRIRPSD